MTTEWDDIAVPALKQTHAREGDERAFEHDTHDLAETLGIGDANQVGRQLESLK